MVSYMESESLDYRIEEDRLKSFIVEEWPNSMVLPQTLASCGFVYEGFHDRVTCYKCSIAVSEWEGTEDVWFVHVKANPFCQFLINTKGVDFIRLLFNLPIPPSMRWVHQCHGNAIIPPDDVKSSWLFPYYERNLVQCNCKLKSYPTQSGCIICKHNYPLSRLLPCGHSSSCKHCSRKLKCCKVCKCPISFRIYTRNN